MTQALNFSITGLYTSQSDFNGLPQGALDIAQNCEIRFRNVLEPRRGFNCIQGNIDTPFTFISKITNFYVGGTNLTVVLGKNSALNCAYWSGSAWAFLPGDAALGIVYPDQVLAASRFLLAGQNLYLTAYDGVRSMASGNGSNMVYAGVPKALDVEAVTNGDTSGFFTNNIVITTTGTVSSASAILTDIADTVGLTTGLYVGGTHIPPGTTVSSITPVTPLIIQLGDTTAGSAVILNVASIAGLVLGVLVSGSTIPEGATVVSSTGTSVTISVASFRTVTGVVVTYSNPLQALLSANATGSATGEVITFYRGSQVGYVTVFGRLETDINGNTVTRLGSPSPVAICENILSTPTNATVTATLPKNSSQSINFIRLYRTQPSPGVSPILIPPLTQYALAYERQLTGTDFTNRIVTITDIVSNTLLGVALYSGSDQEGINQSNDPPPMAWDVAKFRNFLLYGNITQPSTFSFSILSVGSPDGIQIGDTLTVSGTFLGNSFSETFTAASSQNSASQEFQIFSGGTPAQNIADTAQSLVEVINYDEALPVHIILTSNTNDLPGQLILESDRASVDTFMVTASRPGSFDPSLSSLTSDVNALPNYVAISKLGELEGVPALNTLPIGDASSPILRIIGLRDYAFVIKTDGIYKLQGFTPSTMTETPFDLTTRILGADTAVSLNSAVWMYSTQGVVRVSDGGVEQISIPIDDQLNVYVGSNLQGVITNAFGISYESDRKYILAMPQSNTLFNSAIQYCYNYLTSAWTTWSRHITTGYVNSIQNLLYIGCFDQFNTSASVERKSYTYLDFIDETFSVTINSRSGNQVNITNTGPTINPGDSLSQGGLIAEVVAVSGDIYTVNPSQAFTGASATISQSYPVNVEWKQVFGDNPAFVKQFSEGLLLFKTAGFNHATFSFMTDYSGSFDDAPITANPPSQGPSLFNIRFFIPQNQQLGSYILPSLNLQEAYANFKLQGLSIVSFPVSPEVGR